MNRIPCTGPLLNDDCGFTYDVNIGQQPKPKEVGYTKSERKLLADMEQRNYFIDYCCDFALTFDLSHNYDRILELVDGLMNGRQMKWDEDIRTALAFPHAISRALRLKELAAEPFTPFEHKARLLRLMFEQYDIVKAEFA